MTIDVKQLADDISSISEMTPDSTVDDGEEALSDVSDDAALPQRGGTYEIIEVATRRCLTVEKGKLVLAHESSGNKACHWRCEKKEGWFGFSNAVTARYLGYNSNSELVAEAGHHKAWEYIHILPTVAGYYKLLVIQGWKLSEVAVERRNDKLVIRQDGGSAWKFRRALYT
ncbi:hypothetical protein EsDP_00006346 [Epichloe bromicola]|uniref:Uncharacterized protein n=1 Tax=Epichloe bromicola TaxID=79588 RepID=A0ABQ0CXC6_9HYPO